MDIIQRAYKWFHNIPTPVKGMVIRSKLSHSHDAIATIIDVSGDDNNTVTYIITLINGIPVSDPSELVTNSFVWLIVDSYTIIDKG